MTLRGKLALSLVMALAAACKTPAAGRSAVKDDVPSDGSQDGSGWQAGVWSQPEFFGCVPSEAVCEDFCQGRRTVADAADEACQGEGEGAGVGCYCGAY
jgi:hypothetical protein